MENDEPIRIPITDVFDLHTVPPRDVQAVVEEYLSEAHRMGLRALRLRLSRSQVCKPRSTRGIRPLREIQPTSTASPAALPSRMAALRSSSTGRSIRPLPQPSNGPISRTTTRCYPATSPYWAR